MYVSGARVSVGSLTQHDTSCRMRCVLLVLDWRVTLGRCTRVRMLKTGRREEVDEARRPRAWYEPSRTTISDHAKTVAPSDRVSNADC